jgi:hypothetical protein
MHARFSMRGIVPQWAGVVKAEAARSVDSCPERYDLQPTAPASSVIVRPEKPEAHEP